MAFGSPLLTCLALLQTPALLESAANLQTRDAPGALTIHEANAGARDALEQLRTAEHWRDRRAAAKKLEACGDAAWAYVEKGVDEHEPTHVRDACYDLVIRHFGDRPLARERVGHDGLSDPDAGIRYRCAFHSGPLRLYGAHRRLRRLMKDEQENDRTRYAAAKSLAELGEIEVIGFLVKGMQSDSFYPRYLANLGAKAMCGKNLNDCGDYDYSEGAFVSGPGEYQILHPYPVAVHTTLAQRHRAIAEFLAWLEEARPDVFKHLYAPW